MDIVDNLQRLMGQHQQEPDTNVLLKSELNQNVQSFVSFVQPVSGHQVNVDEFNDLNLRINNVSLADLTYNTLKQTGVQVIPASFAFANNLKINNLKVKSMNGLNFGRRSADAIGPAPESHRSLRVQKPAGQQRYPTERDPQSA